MNPTLLTFSVLLLVLATNAFTSRPKDVQTNRVYLNLASNLGENDGECREKYFPSVSLTRREALAALATSNLLLAAPALAEADDEYSGNGFKFRFAPPPGMEPGAKPVKTHLYEINWKSQTVPKYTFGVTVDPVRIQNLKEFGTPEEVAAKVVTAEVNRDGVFEVTLIKDPVAVEEDGVLSYVLNYLSSGKRGDKRFVAKFCIQNQRLYALTGQVAEADYKDKEEEIMKAVDAFRVLPL